MAIRIGVADKLVPVLAVSRAAGRAAADRAVAGIVVLARRIIAFAYLHPPTAGRLVMLGSSTRVKHLVGQSPLLRLLVVASHQVAHLPEQ
jgi:hypothetical protein